MRVVLIHPPVWTLETPPLAITYLSSFLQQNGFAVKCFDLNAELFHIMPNKSLWHPSESYKWKSKKIFHGEIYTKVVEKVIQNLIHKILNENPKVVGITNNANPITSLIAKKIKQRNPQIIVVAGGQLCSPYLGGAELHQDNNIDLIAYGEGEMALLELCKRVQKGASIERISGFFYNGTPILPKLIQRLDELPFPDYSDLDLSRYVTRFVSNSLEPSKSLSILLSRGCVNSCDFCMQRVIWGKPFRVRSSHNVIKEIKYMRDTWGVKRFHFNDLLLNGNLVLLLRLSRELIDYKLNIKWGGNMTMSSKLTPSIVDSLYASGFDHATFGIESGSDKVLKEMGKHYTEKEAEAVLKSFDKPGLNVTINLIIGHPAETDEDFDQTLDFLKRNHILLFNAPSPSICAIFEGSDLLKKYQGKDGFVWNGPEKWSYNENTCEARTKRLNKLIEVTNKLFPSGFFMVDKERALN